MSVFERYAPFIQEYIYKNRWEELREVQVAAADVIFHSDDHLLLAAQTAAGKTEAAFFPAVSDLYENPCPSVGILYISPLKALINDQFVRLEEVLAYGGIPLTKWHADASIAQKKRLLRQPQGILQTTPESLEAMLARGKEEVQTLFSHLRYVIIDEVHYFMEEERGAQLLCILQRIQRLTGNEPRRIGLSATLASYEDGKRWLEKGTRRLCQAPTLTGEKRKLRLWMGHYDLGQKGCLSAFYQDLYRCVAGKKAIIFSNTRQDVEDTIAHLRQIEKREKSGTQFLAHHGNVSASLREYAENLIKKGDTPVVIGATVTLELGIDLGELERIVQIGPPYSVSSFVQKLGRSGRRGNPSEMWFLMPERKRKESGEFYRQIDWNLLAGIATVQLYLEEKWIEPSWQPKLPYSLLYHQTMCYLLSVGEAKPSRLAAEVLTLPPFSGVSQEDYKILLRHLLAIDHLERTEGGGLSLGLAGERTANSYDFVAVFENPEEYTVRAGQEEIGAIQKLYLQGERFALGGDTWEVIEADKKGKTIYVKKAPGLSASQWTSEGSGAVDTKIMKKIQEVLTGNREYAYLSQKGAQRLVQMRILFRHSMEGQNIISLGQGQAVVFPWLGSRAFTTLFYALDARGYDCNMYYAGQFPICMEIRTDCSLSRLRDTLWEIQAGLWDTADFVLKRDISMSGKFQDFIPQSLKKKQYLADCLDKEDLLRNLKIEE